jgi:hypothetical protein
MLPDAAEKLQHCAPPNWLDYSQHFSKSSIIDHRASIMTAILGTTRIPVKHIFLRGVETLRRFIHNRMDRFVMDKAHFSENSP